METNTSASPPSGPTTKNRVVGEFVCNLAQGGWLLMSIGFSGWASPRSVTRPAIPVVKLVYAGAITVALTPTGVGGRMRSGGTAGDSEPVPAASPPTAGDWTTSAARRGFTGWREVILKVFLATRSVVLAGWFSDAASSVEVSLCESDNWLL